MAKKITLSVIVPIHNVELYIERCIVSILSYVGDNLELILVDDESTDCSRDICNIYADADKRVIVIHKENGGVSSARNAGLEIAKGEYITFCDGDDYYTENAIEKIIEHISENDFDLLTFKIADYRSNKLIVNDKNITSYYKINSIQDRMDLIIKETLQKYYAWSVCADVFKRDIIENNSLRFCLTCGNYAEDIGFALKYLFYANTVKGINDSLYVYDHSREESMMNRSEGVIKLNEVNEMAYDVGEEFRKAFGEEVFKQHYPVIFFRLMYEQYVDLIHQGRIKSLSDELKKIGRKEWLYNQTELSKQSKKEFLKYYSKIQVGEYMAMCKYCLNGSYMQYKLQCWFNSKINKQK